MKNKSTEQEQEQQQALRKTDVSGSSLTDIVYGVGIFLMLIIMIFGAIVWALGY